MLEYSITTMQAIRWTMYLSGAACIMAFALLALGIYVILAWKKERPKELTDLERFAEEHEEYLRNPKHMKKVEEDG